jgi:hypothetical protein
MHFLLPMLAAAAVSTQSPQMCAAHSDPVERPAAVQPRAGAGSIVAAAKRALATPPPGLPRISAVRSVSLATYSYADARGIVKIDTATKTVFAIVGFARDGESVEMKRVNPADIARSFDNARLSAAYALQNDRFSEPAHPAQCLALGGDILTDARIRSAQTDANRLFEP